MTSSREEGELLARLRAADPAALLPPTDPPRVAELIEATMTDTRTEHELTESRETHTHDRSPLTWLVAAAAVLIIAGVGIFGAVSLGDRGHDSAPQAQDSVTQLGVRPAVGRCIAPNVGVLRAQTVAFHATVTQLSGHQITFRVDHWFKGGPTTTAKVVAPQSALRPLVESADFKVGGTYLISAHDGQVTSCGFSGPDTARLAALFDQAYGA